MSHIQVLTVIVFVPPQLVVWNLVKVSNKRFLTFTAKVQRRPFSTYAFAISATAHLGVANVADVMDPVARSEAFQRDVLVG